MNKGYKITLFGDSIPKGIVYENSVLKKLEENAVKIVADHYGLKITNLSMFGQTLTRLKSKGTIDEYLNNLTDEDVNVAVISIGGNDSDYNWKEVEKEPSKEHLPKTPPKEFEELLNEIIQKLKSKNVKVIITNIPPVNSERYFNNVICRLADKDKILEFLHGDITNIYRHQELYNLIITKCALKNNCKLIDIREEFLWANEIFSDYCMDGVHPNQNGHKLMAESIIKQLDEKM